MISDSLEDSLLQKVTPLPEEQLCKLYSVQYGAGCTWNLQKIKKDGSIRKQKHWAPYHPSWNKHLKGETHQISTSGHQKIILIWLSLEMSMVFSNQTQCRDHQTCHGTSTQNCWDDACWTNPTQEWSCTSSQTSAQEWGWSPGRRIEGGYRFVKVNSALNLGVDAALDHQRESPECNGRPQLVTGAEERRGLAVAEMMSCRKCGFHTDKKKLYTEILPSQTWLSKSAFTILA